MNNVLITIKKELRTVFRDKKTLSTMFVAPVLIAVFLIFMGFLFDDKANENKVYNVGYNYEMNENEKAVFEAENIKLISYDSFEDMEKAYDDGKVDCYFNYDIEANKYNVYANTNVSNDSTSYNASNEVIARLDVYNMVIAESKLKEANIEINDVMHNFEINPVNLGDEESNYFVTFLLSFGITYLIMGICLAASNMSISATATENENGTLETILTLPVSKKELIVGKYLSCFIVSFIAGLVSLGIIIASLRVDIKFFSIFDSFNLNIGVKSIFGSVLVIAASSMFIAGIAVALTAFASTFKEAQGKAGLLSTISVIPMFVSMVDPTVSTYYYLIPIWNSNQLLNDMFITGFSMSNALLAFGSTLVYSVIVIWYIIKSYNSEKILFNN